MSGSVLFIFHNQIYFGIKLGNWKQIKINNRLRKKVLRENKKSRTFFLIAQIFISVSKYKLYNNEISHGVVDLLFKLSVHSFHMMTQTKQKIFVRSIYANFHAQT